MDQPLRNYRIDRARLVAERFEDETVLVNVESGYYYSLSPTGAEILELLEEGIPVDNLARVLFGESEDSAGFRSRIADFVDQLSAESIIEEHQPEAVAGTFTDVPRHPPGASYELPVLERFDDVRDLLLIDPIHQVDPDFGWPRRLKPESQPEPRI